MLKQIKGQTSLDNAPGIVILVGFVFLLMATMAFIGQKYGESMPSTKTATSVNESVTQAARDTGSGYQLANTSLCNAESFTIVRAINATGGIIPADNYTISSTGLLTNLTGNESEAGTSGTWRVTSTTAYAGTACDVNADLQTEISGNTSIAGIVLTISLVGIVLTILIGVFMGVRGRRI